MSPGCHSVRVASTWFRLTAGHSGSPESAKRATPESPKSRQAIQLPRINVINGVLCRCSQSSAKTARRVTCGCTAAQTQLPMQNKQHTKTPNKRHTFCGSLAPCGCELWPPCLQHSMFRQVTSGRYCCRVKHTAHKLQDPQRRAALCSLLGSYACDGVLVDAHSIGGGV